jgi:hypothetical protein
MPALANLQRKSILTLWGRKDAADMITMGHECENLVWHDLVSETPISLPQQRLESDSPSTLNFNFSRHGLSLMGEATALAMPRLSSIFASENVVANFNRNFPVIDFAGPGKRVFQVTVANSHTKKMQVLDVLMGAGFITKDGESYTWSDPVPQEKLEWYWIVPPFNFKKWGSKKRTQFYKTGAGEVTELKTLLKE